jgi:hypothetical protein
LGRLNGRWIHTEQLGWLKWNGKSWTVFPGNEGYKRLLGEVKLIMDQEKWESRSKSLISNIFQWLEAFGSGLGVLRFLCKPVMSQ